MMVQHALDNVGSMREDVRELNLRMSAVEQQISNMAANEASQYASVSTRLDGIATRIERIERRMDLNSATA